MSSAASGTMPDGADRYSRLSKLGSGTYGVVYRATDMLTGKRVALKKIRSDVWQRGLPATAIREISVLKELSHPNIVRLFEVFISYTGNLYLIMELMDGDLKQVLDASTRSRLPPLAVKAIMYQLAVALSICHKHRIMHRDLKPHNILLSQSGIVKLADFGLARIFDFPVARYTHEVVTLWYRPPEILLGQKIYSAAVDVWSLGCIFAQLLNGEPIFTGRSEIEQIFHIFRRMGSPTMEEWPGIVTLPDWQEAFPAWPRRGLAAAVPSLQARPVACDLLQRMLAYDPQRRIPLTEVLEHEYFDELGLPSEERRFGGLEAVQRAAAVCRDTGALAGVFQPADAGDDADAAAGLPAEDGDGDVLPAGP